MASTKMGSSVNNTRILSDDIKKDKLTSDKGKKDTGPAVPAEIGKLVTRLFEEAGQAVRSSLSGSLQTTAENPLGTLTLTQINTGKKVLQEIQDLLAAKPKLIGGVNKDLVDLSSKFYSSIPQVMELRPKKSDGAVAMAEWLKKLALNEAEKLDKQTELLDLLSDVQGMVGGFATTDVGKKYAEIGCEYTLVDDKEDSFKKVKEYFTASHSKTPQLVGQDGPAVARLRQRAEGKALAGHEGGGQHQASLPRIGPAEHPGHLQARTCSCDRPASTSLGSMFGNGLYFADQSSKSQQYAFGRYGGGGGRGDTYFMFVADVALGKIMKYQNSQSHLNKAAPKGYHSVQGEAGSGLVHNEFIIYTLQQHLLQYLIEFSTRY
jgi:poly [ADP-ribose] polymerase